MRGRAGGGGPGGPPFAHHGFAPLGGAAPKATATEPQPKRYGTSWDPYLGESEIDQFPLSRAVWSASAAWAEA